MRAKVAEKMIPDVNIEPKDKCCPFSPNTIERSCQMVTCNHQWMLIASLGDKYLVVFKQCKNKRFRLAICTIKLPAFSALVGSQETKRLKNPF